MAAARLRQEEEMRRMALHQQIAAEEHERVMSQAEQEEELRKGETFKVAKIF